MRILVAEDDPSIASGVVECLLQQGHAVDHVDSGRSADAALRENVYDLLVLDIGLPHLDGLDVLRHARDRGDEVAVLVITARDAIGDRVRSLDMGADDYLLKPFALAEFGARVRALLRRRASSGVPEVRIGRLRVALADKSVKLDDQAIELTAREFALLEALLPRREHLVTRARLVEAVCSWDRDLSDNGLDIAIHRLRRKLGGSGISIRTIRGLGYILQESADADAAPRPG